MSDVVVVGGGLTGLAAAVAAARAGCDTVHLAPAGRPDRRTSALMLPAVSYLQDAGLIASPEGLGHPLTAIRIIDATGRLLRAPETLFEAAETGHAAFGWNLPNIALTESLAAAATALPNLRTLELAATALSRSDGRWHLTLSDGQTLSARLIVGADGKASLVRAQSGISVRERAFSEAALVCDLTLGRPLGGTSVEFHYDHGPFTLVPAGGNRANLVWIDDHERLDQVRSAGPEALRAAILERSQRLFGDITLATPAHVFALSTLTVDVAGRDGVVLVGEAAHAFPPIGAQGLNLGLRDVAELSRAFTAINRSSTDWADHLSAFYATARARDLELTGGVVDALFRSLLMDMLPAQAVRAGGLWAMKLLPPLRRRAFDIGMGQR